MAYCQENLLLQEAFDLFDHSEDSQTMAWLLSGFPIILARALPENIIVESTFIVRKSGIPCRLACLYRCSTTCGGVCVLGNFSGPEELMKKYPELLEEKGTLLIS